MAANNIRIKTASRPQVASEYLDAFEQFSDGYARLKRHFAAMTQQKDGDGTQASHFAQTTAVYGFVAADGTTPSDAASKLSYDEVNSLIGNCGAAIEQACAKHKQ